MTNYNGVIPPCRGKNERDEQQQRFIELVDGQLDDLFESQNVRFVEF